ncbi:MAG: hypothetical protein H6737_04615 [Alphaproteobacteria bacterium]|nr:hypothetical protein [Alphaproteobacteria bacterium]
MTALIRAWATFRELTSTLVLGIVWLAVLTPAGLISRAVREDPLRRSFDPEAPTYWEPRDAPPSSGLVAFLTERGKLWLVPIVLVLLAVGAIVVLSEGSALLVLLYPLS